MTVDAASHVRALIRDGDARAAQGDLRAAVSFYGSALKAAQMAGRPPADLVPDLRRIHQVSLQQAAACEAHLRDRLDKAGHVAGRANDRFDLSLDLMSGRKTLYAQEPQVYLLPGLPLVEFQPRETLPWIAEVEAAAPAIRAELETLMAQPGLFRPYVESKADRPNGDQAGMLENPDWSAVFLWKDGVEQPGMVRRCPETMRAMSRVPLCRIPGRTPSILFSRLAAGARIPPHHGMVNIRLICHLPLVTPPGCRLKVGNSEREWRDGEAWAFDDTILHSARNDSDRDRVVLIFDVWKDEVSDEERRLIVEMFQALDQFGAPGGAWGV